MKHQRLVTLSLATASVLPLALVAQTQPAAQTNVATTAPAATAPAPSEMTLEERMKLRREQERNAQGGPPPLILQVSSTQTSTQPFANHNGIHGVTTSPGG